MRSYIVQRKFLGCLDIFLIEKLGAHNGIMRLQILCKVEEKN